MELRRARERDADAVAALFVAARQAMKRLGMKRRQDLDFTDKRFGPETNPQIVYWIDAADWPSARAAALS